MQYVNESETHGVSWSAIGALLRRYVWLILAVFLTTVATGLVVLQVFFTDLYETKATLLVKVGRETTEVPATVVNGQLLSQGVRIQDINSEVQILSSRALVETAVDRIGPDKFKSVLKAPDSIWGYPKYYLKVVARWGKGVYKEVLYTLNLKKRLPFREEVIVAVSESLKVEPVKESDVLVLKLRLPSAELSVQTANEILSEYMARRGQVRNNAAALDYFEAQAKEHRDKMNALAASRARVRDTFKISAAGEQRSLLLKQLSDLETQKVDIDSQVQKLEQERKEMQQKLAAIPAKLTKEETHTRNPALQSLKERLTNLEMERAKLTGRYQPDSEMVRKLTSEIESLNQALQRETPTVLATTVSEQNPLRKEFEKGIEERQVAIAGLVNRSRQLDQPIQEIRDKVGMVTTGSDAYENIEREYRMAEQSYFMAHKRREEARVSEELDESRVANVSLVAAPELPLEPIYPRKLFIMGILLPAALVLGVGIAALLETLNDKVRVQGDVQGIPGVDYLGSVGITPSRRRLRRVS